MFTGLIEDVGVVTGLVPVASGHRLRIRTPLAAEMRMGESIAVDGVCLTVTACDESGFSADIGPETARVTTLGSLVPDQPVNLERSMRAEGRFGGHFVQGHIDAAGLVEDTCEDGDSRWMAIRVPPELEHLLVLKGSIAVDGVSLTVAQLERGRFHVMIIPFTWAHTALSSRRPGDRVNLECDIVGKYVARSIELGARTGLTT